ncbi:hypothetical protein ZIOFF_057299 [Zingiber officinale]|uniref:Uncharacterized protein n=1 Tax=Zingiber officinale TaxID=94328 RepID=A0A8J5FCA4_ZINOF|nr:hypothetical protein ZIOFF_057299 [Zingiber officinale]
MMRKNPKLPNWLGLCFNLFIFFSCYSLTSFAMAASFFFRSIQRLPLRTPGTFAAQQIRRFPSFSRIPVELGCCGASLFPFHSAVAAARMTSRLSLASRSNRDISQCFLGYACRGP